MMKNELARNPRRHRRNPKLSRNKKIGIALASVAAVGGVTALVLAMRSKKKRDTPFCGVANGQPMIWNADTQQCEPASGGQGSSGTSGTDRGNALNRARRRFCINPQALTLDQMLLLQQEVFLPLLEATLNPVDYASVAIVKEAALDQLCAGIQRPATQAMAGTLAQRVWENYTGFGG